MASQLRPRSTRTVGGDLNARVVVGAIKVYASVVVAERGAGRAGQVGLALDALTAVVVVAGLQLVVAHIGTNPNVAGSCAVALADFQPVPDPAQRAVAAGECRGVELIKEHSVAGSTATTTTTATATGGVNQHVVDVQSRFVQNIAGAKSNLGVRGNVRADVEAVGLLTRILS